MTDADRHARVTALFLDALEQPAGERATWLAAACDDADVRREVAAMLVHAEEDGSMLDRPVFVRPAGRGAEGSAKADPLVGRRVGPWRVTALLGHGGMGAVYRAERDDGAFAQRAALKLVHPALAADFRLRFLRERDVLAALDHPGIARLLDGGVTDEGDPYLAMELVEGAPITAYAKARELGVAERLTLIVQACDAVAHAHRRLVVHRDLKPDHVLIAEDEGGAPHVKLLDFGVAKLMNPDPLGSLEATPADALTRTGPGPLTPAYAAPEQFLGQPVTTATDVYALGVVLYELLAARRPYALEALTAAQAERIVCEVAPPRPSAVAHDAARSRALRGDLDHIVLKALAKEPDRRYPSADALADDLRRHLDGLPVRARPATAHYRMGRFARRNRVAVSAAVVVTVALVVGAGVALRQASMAREEADKATAMNTFLQSTLLAASPAVGAAVRPSDLRVVDVLRPAAEQAQSAFPGRPDVRAAVLYTVGRTYLDLGLWDEAGDATLAALALRDSLYGDTPHEERIQSYDVAAQVAQMRNDISALDWAQRAFALRTARYGHDSPQVVEGLGRYGDLLAWFGRYIAAENALQRALELAARTHDVHGPEAERVRFALALLFLQTDRAAAADTLLGGLAARARKRGPTDGHELALYVHYRTSAALFLRDVDRAEHYNVEALRRLEARFDGDHPVLNEARGLHAAILIERGHFAEAEAIMRAAVAAFEASLEGTDRFELHLARAELGAALSGLGRTAEAEQLLRLGTERLRVKFGDAYDWTRHTARHLADLYEATGRPMEARPYRAIADAPRSVG